MAGPMFGNRLSTYLSSLGDKPVRLDTIKGLRWGLEYEHEESSAMATTCPILVIQIGPIFFIRRLARLSELRHEFHHFAFITCST
jgi:hypothetical protein